MYAGIDGFSHYTWVYPLKIKDQVFETWKKMVENVSGKRVKTLQTDNGGEYTGERFKEHLNGFVTRPRCLRIPSS